MIVQREGNNWLLITQPAHAWLAGKLAAAWGNETFGSPSPFEAVILATRLHDIGWLDWDASPRLGEDGRPVNFVETNLAETIPIWRRAVNRISLMDPYAALLVSKHASTIYHRRHEGGADPPEERSELEAILAEQEAIQRQFCDRLSDHPVYGPAVEADQLKIAYRWLRVCDIFSLILCSDALPLSGVIESVPGQAIGDLTSISYERPAPFQLVLDPWPYRKPTITLSVQTRRLAENSFQDEASYRTSLSKTPWIPQTVTLSTRTT
jgi:hypothetical protein